MQRFVFFVVFLAFALPLYAAEQDDAQLTSLMAGAWRSPRHDYLYFADGTWWMGKPDACIAHGRWLIKDHHLVESITWGADAGPSPSEDHGLIQKLTRHEILFDGVYHMKRIKRLQVEE